MQKEKNLYDTRNSVSPAKGSWITVSLGETRMELQPSSCRRKSAKKKEGNNNTLSPRCGSRPFFSTGPLTAELKCRHDVNPFVELKY